MTVPRSNAATTQAAQPDTSIYITRFDNITEYHGQVESYANWREFFDALRASTHDEFDQLPAWSPAVFDRAFRRSMDVERVGAVVLRYRAGQIGQHEAFEFWSEQAFGVTTPCFSYTMDQYGSTKPAFCIVIPLAAPLPLPEFTEIAETIAELAEERGHHVEPGCSNPVDACLWATSRANCLGPREHAKALDPRRLMPSAPQQRSMAQAVPTSASFSLEKWLSEVRSSTSDGAGKALNRSAFVAGLQVTKGNLEQAAATKELVKAGIDAGLPAAEAEKVVKRALQKGREAASERGDADRWDDQKLKKLKDGTIDGSLVSNLILILKGHPAWRSVIRYSEFDHRVHFFSPPFNGSFYAGQGKRQKWLEDNDLTCVRSWLETAMGVNASKEAVIDAVVAVGMSQSFHQVRDWLDGLQWDGVPRIRGWLQDYCGAEVETEAQKIAVPAMGMRWLISAVARAYDPGAKADCTLVLEGEQSIKKSTTFATLVPHEAWFSDERLNLDSKDTLQQMQGKWIIEIAELASFRGKASEDIKHFLSKKADDFRKPYGKINQPYPRQCVFGGTVNDTEYLNDPTGARRFFPVRCHGLDRTNGKIDIDGLRSVRDQLWAEAVYLYKHGEQCWLTEEEEEAAKVEQEGRFAEDPWQPFVADWVSRYDAQGRLMDEFSMSTVLQSAVNIEPAKQGKLEQTRMKNILLRLGFRRKQVPVGDGRREWRYCRKK